MQNEKATELLTLNQAALTLGVSLDEIYRYRDAWDRSYCDCPKCCPQTFSLEPKTNDDWAWHLYGLRVFNVYRERNARERSDWELRWRADLAFDAVDATAKEIYPRQKNGRVGEEYAAVIRKLRRLQKAKGDVVPWADVHAIVRVAPWSREIDEANSELMGGTFRSHDVIVNSELRPPKRLIVAITAKAFGVTIEDIIAEGTNGYEEALPTEIPFWIDLHERALQKRKRRRPAIAHLLAGVFEQLRHDYLWLTGLDKPNWSNDTHLHGDFIDFQKAVWNVVSGRSPSEATLRGRYSAR